MPKKRAKLNRDLVVAALARASSVAEVIKILRCSRAGLYEAMGRYGIKGTGLNPKRAAQTLPGYRVTRASERRAHENVTTFCECSRRKAKRREACGRCRHRDMLDFVDPGKILGATMASEIIHSIRMGDGEATLACIVEDTGRAESHIQRCLYALMEAGRVRQVIVDTQYSTEGIYRIAA